MAERVSVLADSIIIYPQQQLRLGSDLGYST